MKITHVRISRLESGPGYNNRSCSLEAEIEEGENYAEVAEELRKKVELQLGLHREHTNAYRTLENLQDEVAQLIMQKDRLTGDIQDARKIIREHSQLADIAREKELDVAGLTEEIPF